MTGAPMSDKFREKMTLKGVRDDTRTLGDFTAIYCGGTHDDRVRRTLESDAASLGVYGNKVPVLCDECAEHLRYAEKRRAYCVKDPKPFCAHCDSQCYKAEELLWQRQMMRYSGPRSLLRGHAIGGIRHALEARKYKKSRNADASGAREESR